MASNIDLTNIDTTYPIAGQDNDSQGFRDNFTNINTNFTEAKTEIEALQSSTSIANYDFKTDQIPTVTEDNWVLTYNNSTGLISLEVGTGITSVSADGTPALGGDLTVAGNSIVSTAAGDIAITPDTTGNIILDGLNWPQADGTADQILKTDGSGQLSWVDAGGGGGVTNPLTADLVTDGFTIGTVMLDGADEGTQAVNIIGSDAVEWAGFPTTPVLGDHVNIFAGDGYLYGSGGNVKITAGKSNDVSGQTGDGGDITIEAGASNWKGGDPATAVGATTTGGEIIIISGKSFVGVGGDIRLESGDGDGTFGFRGGNISMRLGRGSDFNSQAETGTLRIFTANGNLKGSFELVDSSVGGNSHIRVTAPTIVADVAGMIVFTGTGVPAIVADVGSLYTRTDGGAGSTLYVKESGTGTSAGWVAK